MKRPPAKITHEIVLIKPAEAALLLQKKRLERRLNPQQVEAFAEDMRMGRWRMNGEPVILGQSGQVLDGVLRLAAGVQAKVPFPALLVRGVADSAFDTIDAVRSRTVGDILSIKDEENGRALAAALAVLWRYANDNYAAPGRKVTAQQRLQILANNPDVRLSMALAADASSFMSLGVVAAMHYLFWKRDPEKANEFFHELVDEEVDEGPAYLLRRQLQALQDTRGMKSQGLVIGLFIKAWEAFVAGEPMKQLRFVPGTDNPPRVSGIDEDALRTGLASVPEAAAGGRRPRLNARGIEVEIVDVDPAMAEMLLERNDHNRPISGMVVKKYARDIKSGAWKLNGQTIKVAKDGRLLDGQHRLQAGVLANKPFPAMIVRGLDPSVFETFDLGSKRAFGDILRDLGETNTSLLAACLRQVWLFENGLLQSRGAAPTNAELMSTLKAHPELRDSVRNGQKIRDITAPTLVIALHYFFRRVHPRKADFFLNRLTDGAELPARHPILTLRDQLVRAKIDKKVSIPDAERAAWIIKAWNAYLQDRPVATLKWQQVGPRKEPFPEVPGLVLRKRAA
ncbi:MAG: hypothetical protein Q8R82_07160 [Hyphomonadaceae bacterium]|nr:hypothetical protein [Hyphomonadaceae bacterium]